MTSVRSASSSDSRDARLAGSTGKSDATRAAGGLVDAEPSRDEAVLQLSGLQRRFGALRALSDVDLTVRRGETVGLVGRNGSGKTTLLRHAAGLLLPDAGTCRVFGRPSERLDDATLARIGYVPQQARFLPWMTVQRHCDYVASFHDTWDDARRSRLLVELELDPRALVGTLTPGDVQKLALITAVCQRPGLVLLDEPVSALDPLAREAVLAFLVDLLAEDSPALIISSHGLRDVERIVERVVCLATGQVVVDGGLDALRERHAEWRLVSPSASLPARFDEPFVLRQEGDARQARLCVRDAEPYRAAFEARHRVAVEVTPLNLERLFPLWADAGTPRSTGALR